MPLNVYIILFLFNKINKKSNIYCSFLYKNTNIMQIRCIIRGAPYRVCGRFGTPHGVGFWFTVRLTRVDEVIDPYRVCGGVVGRRGRRPLQGFVESARVDEVTASPYDPSVKSYGFDSSPFSGAEFKALGL